MISYGKLRTFGRLFLSFFKITIFRKIFYSMLTIVLLGVSFSSAFSFIYTKKTYSEDIIADLLTVNRGLNRDFEYMLGQIDQMTAWIYSNKDIMNILTDSRERTTFEKVLDERIVSDFFYDLTAIRKEFVNMYIYVSPYRSFYYYLKGVGKVNYDPREEEWFQETQQADGKTVISAPHTPYQLVQGNEVISFSRLLKTLDGTVVGMLLIDIPATALDQVVDSELLREGTLVSFVDQNGHVIYSNPPLRSEGFPSRTTIERIQAAEQSKFKVKYQNEDYLLVNNYSEVTGWNLIMLTRYDQINEASMKFIGYHVAIAIIGIIFSAVLSLWFSHTIYKPLKLLFKGMTRVQMGNMQTRVDLKSQDELGQLGRHFNLMLDQIKELTIDRYQEQLARKEAEYRYLQAQINPHFIFNTLQTICSMAVIKEASEIYAISNSLAKLIRYSVEVRQHKVPFGKEMQNTNHYLEIQKIRFGDRFNFQLNIDEKVKDVYIIKLVLQPIVENAVLHGLLKNHDSGMIRITAALKDQELEVEVYDNGAGITLEKLNQLRNILDRQIPEKFEPTSSSFRIGLTNVQQRIRLMYGDAYGIQIDSQLHEWTSVKIRMPVVYTEEEAIDAESDRR